MAMGPAAAPASEEDSMRLSMARSYGTFASGVEGRLASFAHILVLMLALTGLDMTSARAAFAGEVTPVKLVMLGDSLSAGLGLSAADAFPAKLQKALRDKGIAVDISNAGVSGDTSSGGRDRLDWSVPEGAQGVILELGANDALRGPHPAVPRAALEWY